MHKLDQLTAEDITQKLKLSATSSQHSHTIPQDMLSTDYRQAGVLIPLVRIENHWHLLYIRRAEIQHDRHSGQVAFPGGKHEEQDTDLYATALREAHEEVGIHPHDVSVLGQLSDHHSVSNFRITPVIGLIPWPYPLTLQTNEVSHTFTIPLHWLADSNNYEMRPWQAPNLKQQVKVAHFNEYDGELLWGATARMTLSLLGALCNQPNG